jgi:hypothetical protein
MDALALYATPEGSPASEGTKLCTIYAGVRKALADKAAAQGIIDNAAVAKYVEDSLKTNIPGGALPCPLLQYPTTGATDEEWLAWLKNIPTDFGARVVFMVMYVDNSISPTTQKINDILEGKGIPRSNEPFKNPTAEVDTLIQTLKDTKTKLLSQNQTIDPSLIGDPDKLFAEMKMRIKRTQDTTDSLKEQQKAGLQMLSKAAASILSPPAESP